MGWPGEIRQRTELFAISIVQLVRDLPKSEEARIIGRQLLRSGTSVAANYRSVCRARSRAEFVARIGVVVEKADETVFWLEMLRDSDIFNGPTLGSVLQEANELLAIVAASQRAAKSGGKKSRRANGSVTQ